MKLELETGPWNEALTDDSIAVALGQLDGDQCSYAILDQTEETYLQTCGSPESGFVLEYQVEDLDHHYQSLRQDIPLTAVVTAFQKYARGDASWQHDFEWRKLDPVVLKPPQPRKVFFAIMVVLVALVAVLRCFRE